MHEQILAKISGKETKYVSATKYVEKAHEERNELKEILKREAWNLKRVPKFAKAELVEGAGGILDIPTYSEEAPYDDDWLDLVPEKFGTKCCPEKPVKNESLFISFWRSVTRTSTFFAETFL